MYRKLNNIQCKSLKQLWKWLKNIVYEHSQAKKWRKKTNKLIEDKKYSLL